MIWGSSVSSQFPTFFSLKMEEDQELKHICKFCFKIYPCGRSLGGHMRSHVTSIDENKKKINNGDHRKFRYGLKGNSKKTWRVCEENYSISDEFCEVCGKKFQSWKALFGHMKDSSKINNYDNETGSSSCSVSEIEQEEQEEIALCLMMLSRDNHKLNSVSEESSGSRIEIKSSDCEGFNSIKRNSEKLRKSDSEISNKNLVISVDDEVSDHVVENSKLKENASDQAQSDDHKHNSSIKRKNRAKLQSDFNNRSNFECHTCNKLFHSYQALGGHRASHNKKKIRNCYPKIDSCKTTIVIEISSDLVGKSDSSKKKNISRVHECSICFKVFSSGQALGGHKRSHSIAAPNNQIEKSEVRDFLDLNLPAPVKESETSTTTLAGFQPWWLGSSSKHESLFGLISKTLTGRKKT